MVHVLLGISVVLLHATHSTWRHVTLIALSVLLFFVLGTESPSHD